MEDTARKQPRRWSLRAWHVLVGVVVLLVLMIAAIAALPNWNFLRTPIANYLSGKLQRTVSIDGDLKVRLSLHPTVEVNGLKVANASWAAHPTLAQAEQVQLQLDLPALLRGRLIIPQLQLDHAVVALETNREGASNWELQQGRSTGGTPPEVGALIIKESELIYDDAPAAASFRIAIASDTGAQHAAKPTIRFAGRGSLRKGPFQIEGQADSLWALTQEGEPYHLEVRAVAGDSKASFTGSVVPLKLETIDGTLTLSGKDLSKLYPLVPVPLPWTPPYQLSGHFLREGGTWSFRDFKGKVGNSDLVGNFSLNRKSKRPVITADVTSTRLDYKDLGGVVGVPPPNTKAQRRPPDQEREAAKRAATEKALPTKPYDLSRLRAVDADVRFKGKNVVARDIPLDNVVAHLILKDGQLRFAPLDFGIADGHVVSEISVDAAQPVMVSAANVTVRGVDVGKLFPELKANKASAGRVGGEARLQATGNSIAQLSASADGEVAIVMAKGRLSTISLLLTNLDLANAAELLMRGDKNAPVYCAVLSGQMQQGVFTPRLFVVDSSEEHITGEGGIDFRNERYEIKLTADSKRASLVALRGPIRVEGTFKHPRVVPEAGPLVARVAAAVALGALLTPPAALLALADPGGARDSNCSVLFAQADKTVNDTPNPAAQKPPVRQKR